MNDRVLSVADKAKLTDFAREVIARSQRASEANPARGTSEEPVDAFSLDGLQRRILTLEKDFAALDQRVEQSLAVILMTVQRLEARAAQTSGELSAVREDIDAQAGSRAYSREELMASAKDYGAILNGELTQLIARLEKVSASCVPKEQKTAEPVGDE